VQACAAELVRLDKRDLQAELGRPDGGGVTTHPTPENRDVEVEIRHYD
jgi:hypothetical protein